MRAVAVVVAAAVLFGCAGDAETPPEIRGQIVEIEGEATITAFVVESEDGRHRILIDPRRDYGFELDHLREHQEQSLPVLVRSRRRGEAAYATAIEDG